MVQLYNDDSSKILNNLERCRKRKNLVISKIEEEIELSIENAIDNLLNVGILSDKDVEKLKFK